MYKGMPQHYDVLPEILTANRVRTFAEIGVYKGQFTKKMLRQIGCYLDNYWAIDQWSPLTDGDTGWMADIPIAQWDDYYYSACKLMTYFPNLRVLRQPSVTAATLFPDGYFDMVYIDASHFYEEVLKDIRAWKPKVRPGGILGGHDYVHRRANMRAKQAVDDSFPEGVTTLEDAVWMVQL